MEMEVISRMSKDIKLAAITLSDNEARYLVDTYYQMQESRIRDDHRIRQQDKIDEPHAVLSWLREQDSMLEKQIKGVLGKYADAHVMGRWMQEIVGIGPVIAAGILSHVDITRAPTAGALWRYAGIEKDPTPLEKGQKRYWNSSFKSLVAFKLGECFVKFSNHPEDFYGKYYKKRKEYEIAQNEAGAFAAQAAAKLPRYKPTTVAYGYYKKGLLPPAQIHARARRWAVKLFLSHVHEVWHWYETGTPAPETYVMAHMGHVHKIEPPNFDKNTFPTKNQEQQ